MDVGQGDAIFIESPAGHRILVDGGPSGRSVSEALGDEMPFWDKRIDWLCSPTRRRATSQAWCRAGAL
jgi:hypothetical protein